jgi:hypothetical protein
LDSRIIASAFCVPRINTPRADLRNSDYCEIWEESSLAVELGDNSSDWGRELNHAVNADLSLLQEQTEAPAMAFFEGSRKACESTNLSPRLFAGETIDHLQALVYGKRIAEDWMKTAGDRKRFAKLNRAGNFSGGKKLYQGRSQKSRQ